MPTPFAKHNAPAVESFSDHEVITPPNKLRKAIKPASPRDEDPVARAEQAMADLASEFSIWMEQESERLDVARNQIREAGFTPQTREKLFHAAHDIKGEAATFGYPSVAAVAESLCRLIEHTPSTERIPFALVEQHVDAVRAIVREHADVDANTKATTLIRQLRAVTDEFLVHENKDRPDHLEAILGPTLLSRLT
jgi:HPt (histidine-containing phosphotransfer) domain-containing protein